MALKKQHFSKPQLIVFILAFALIGFILVKSFAANPNLAGDINNDNKVDITDMSILLTAYGTNNANADLDGNGIVGITDLSILMSHFGQSYTPAPTVNPVSLPNGTVGQAYSQSVTASGGNAGPYSLRVTQGNLPSGITFNGSLLAGTPATAGTYAFTISAFDTSNTYSGGFRDYNMTIAPGSGGGGGTPLGYYLYYQMEGSPFPASPFDGTTFFPTGASYRQVSDPLGTEGQVALLEDDYSSSLPTDYSTGALQQSAISVNPPYAHAGYQTTSESTWYRVKVMFPSGNVFANGETNYLVEWHNTTTGTGPKSSGLLAYGGYPLTPGGTTTPKLIFRTTTGDASGNLTNIYFPGGGSGSAGEENASNAMPALLTNHWYNVVWHWVWSTDSSVGKMEYWIDGTKYASVTQQTQTVGDYYSFAVYNYRYNVTGNSRIYYGLMGLGPTAASIGFTP